MTELVLINAVSEAGNASLKQKIANEFMLSYLQSHPSADVGQFNIFELEPSLGRTEQSIMLQELFQQQVASAKRIVFVAPAWRFDYLIALKKCLNLMESIDVTAKKIMVLQTGSLASRIADDGHGQANVTHAVLDALSDMASWLNLYFTSLGVTDVQTIRHQISSLPELTMAAYQSFVGQARSLARAW